MVVTQCDSTRDMYLWHSRLRTQFEHKTFSVTEARDAHVGENALWMVETSFQILAILHQDGW